MTDRELGSVNLLGSPQGPYVKQLIASAERMLPRTPVRCLSFTDLQVQMHAGGVQSVRTRALCDTSGSDTSEPNAWVELTGTDGIIVRTMPLGSLEQVIFRMDALQVAESIGCTILNSPRALEAAIDKWLTLHRLAERGLQVPQTRACQSRDAALEAFEEFGCDAVVKPIFGGEGRGIVRVTDVDIAWRVFSTLEQMRAVIYVQPFLDNFGYDIRVLVIGDRMLAMKRRARDGEWRANISRGSQPEVHELTDAEREQAQAAADAVGATFVGVDLLPTVDGSCPILEVNAVPGWNGIQAAHGVNVADLVIRHLAVKHLEERSRRG
ncbi:MAG: RimK family alpha-L-glutamate ligase [Pirellulales bacterium]